MVFIKIIDQVNSECGYRLVMSSTMVIFMVAVVVDLFCRQEISVDTIIHINSKPYLFN